MKKLLVLVLGATLLCGPVEAQSFLKKLGKNVERNVKNVLKEGANKNSQEKAERPQPAAQPASKPAAQPASKPAAQPVATKASAPAPAPAVTNPDKGENIVQQPGLDYIDEYGINHGGGILIGDILWAPVNCGYHATDFPYGKLYQWGRKHGQGYNAPFASEQSNVNPDKKEAEVVPGPATPAEARKHPNTFYAKSDYALFNWTTNDMKLWNNFTDDGTIFKNKTNDPCPEGWRVPELFDFYDLVKNHSKLVQHPETGQMGMWFSGSQPYSTSVPRIFLPAAGMRLVDAKAVGRHVCGYYWSLRHGGGEGLVWHLYFNKKPEVSPMAYPHEAYSVRCVKDIKGQKMK